MSSAIRYDGEGLKEQVGEMERLASQVPDACGYRILVIIPDVKETTEGGIVIPEERRDAEQVASIVGWVASVGPDAYKDKSRFPGGPWCKEGDWIVMRAYAGTRLKVRDTEFRIINDDSVECVVEDPRGVSRL